MLENKMPSFEELKEWLLPVLDPDIGVSLVGLGLIYEINLSPADADKFKAQVVMSLTSPMCPAAASLQDQVNQRMKEHPAISDVEVKLVFEPKWDPHTMASDEVKDRLGIW